MIALVAHLRVIDIEHGPDSVVHPLPPSARCGRAISSGDDIWDQLILQRGNLVLELKLALFEARNLQLIARGREDERVDRRVQIAMFLPQQADLANDLGLIHSCYLNRNIRGP
jgi:hypothetical protein